MPRILLTYVGVVNGVKAYAPMDAADVKAIGNKTTIVCELKGMKALITNLQMRSVHLYFRMLSDALNAAGLDMKAVMAKLSKNALIPWTPDAVKERLWRPVIIDSFNKESTTQLETGEIGTAYEALNMVTGEQLGVSVPFPDKYNLIEQQLRNQ